MERGVGWGDAPHPPAGGKGVRIPSTGRVLQFLNKNNAFLSIFWPK